MMRDEGPEGRNWVQWAGDSGLSFRDVVGPPWGEDMEEEAAEQERHEQDQQEHHEQVPEEPHGEEPSLEESQPGQERFAVFRQAGQSGDHEETLATRSFTWCNETRICT